MFCLFVCLSAWLFVCLLSTLTFPMTFEPLEPSYRFHILHAYSTYDALSNDTNVDDLVTLTLTLCSKNSFLGFVAAGGIVSVSQTHLDISLMNSRSINNPEK